MYTDPWFSTDDGTDDKHDAMDDDGHDDHDESQGNQVNFPLSSQAGRKRKRATDSILSGARAG